MSDEQRIFILRKLDEERVELAERRKTDPHARAKTMGQLQHEWGIDHMTIVRAFAPAIAKIFTGR